jgi:crotonobetainyl-CoA:carnitine CoA-transferase CaiB-like acyl-CoA transferase
VTGPLTGIRVLDAGTVLAAPVACTMLGDFGAEVVSIELPGVGDLIRARAAQPGGRTLQWVQEARNKKSITLDLHQSRGRDLLHRLIPHFDVLVTNFRPATLDRWELAPRILEERYPRLVGLFVSGYGQTGPYRNRGAFDRTASAFAGVTAASGMPEGPPVRAGFALIDYMTAYLGAFGVMLALYERDTASGKGQMIDLALYESAFRATEDAYIDFSVNETVRARSGNRNPHIAPADDFHTADGKEVSVHAGSDSLFRRLANVMRRDDLAQDRRFSTYQERLENQDELYAEIAAWAAGMSAERLIAVLSDADVPAAGVLDMAAISKDQHYRQREKLFTTTDSEFGELEMVNVIPRLSRTPGSIESLGPVLGAHNQEVYGGWLGLDPAMLESLEREGVI